MYRPGMPTRREFMLIADIGGYTDYMQFHRSILGHAEAATSRMLDKVVERARGFDLIGIEGDAAFLAKDVAGLSGPEVMTAVLTAVAALHSAFHTERRLVQLNMCPCGSCKKTDDLTLKFVAHVGEVATQTIRGRRSIVGLDVIHVHRLLKNPVQIPEYLLVSEELYREGGDAATELAAQEMPLTLEGIGDVHAYVINVSDLAPPAPDPTWPQRIGATFAMVGRGLPYAIGRDRRRGLAGAA
jgi:Protein of unknown function (DUF2652)